MVVSYLCHRDDIQEIYGDALQQRARGALLRKQQRFGRLVLGGQELVEGLVGDARDVIVDFVDDIFDDWLSLALARIVLDDGLALLGAGAEDLQSGKALDAELPTERFVEVFVAVDGGDLGQALQVLGGFLVGGLEVLAMSAPGGVELDDLEERSLISALRWEEKGS